MNILIMFSVFVPLFITLMMFNKYTTDSIYSNVRGTAENAFLQLYDIFSSRFEVIRQDTMMLQTNESTRELLQEGISILDISRQIKLKSQVNSLVSLIENKNIWGMQLRVYVSIQRSLLYDNQNYFPLALASNALWYNDLTQNPYKNMWIYYPSSSQEHDSRAVYGSIFSYLVRIVDPENFKQTTSILQYDFIKDQVLSTMRQSLPLMDGACVFLADEQGQVILQAGGLEDGGLPEPVSSRKFSATTWDTFTWKGRAYHVQRRSFKNNPWQMVMLVPFGNSIDSLLSNAQWSTFLALALICGIVIYLFSMLFSKGVIKRLALVSVGMSNLKDGVLQPLPEPRVRDEVGVLIESYNYLTDELNLLTASRSMARANQKHAEMKALQAQINPHFLYNTLEMINYFAFMNNAARVEKIVTLLSRFYKLCLNQGAEFSTLSQELDLTQVFWGIQEIRYEGKIKLQIEISHELLEHRVPHIILQPIVENAIHHGIMNRPDQMGVILIRGRAEQNDLVLDIIDNGAGMTEEKIRQIREGMDLHFDVMEEGSHYGLRNIHERLLEFYGLGYGLSFSSVPGEGTTVTVRLPLQ